MNSHAAAARELYGQDQQIVDCVIENDLTGVSEKMRALLTIAGKVQRSGKSVTPEDIQRARENGAVDRDIHDTILIAATFSMFNRYVDGLASLTPTDPKAYKEMGKRMTTIGYVLPQPIAK
jgi:alkylhydroperoxidase family enzyme